MENINDQLTKALKAIPQKKQSPGFLTTLSDNAKLVLQIYSTVNIFAKEKNLEACMCQYDKYRSYSDALKSGKIKLSELEEAYTESKIISWLGTWLIMLAKYMDFGISEPQVTTTSRELYNQLKSLNIVELTLFFRKLLSGDYGTFYNKFNGQIILSGAKKYKREHMLAISKLPSDLQRKLSR